MDFEDQVHTFMPVVKKTGIGISIYSSEFKTENHTRGPKLENVSELLVAVVHDIHDNFRLSFVSHTSETYFPYTL